MPEKLRYSMQQRRGKAEEWQNSGFVPQEGEIIVYNEGEAGPAKIKIGNGESSSQDLKGITGEVYVQPEVPTNAGIGALWVEPQGEISLTSQPTQDKTRTGQVDWDQQDKEESDFINNRPFWNNPIAINFNSEGLIDIEIYKDETIELIFSYKEDWPKPEIDGRDCIGAEFIINDQKYIVKDYCYNWLDVQKYLESTESLNCIALDASISGLGVNGIAFAIIPSVRGDDWNILQNVFFAYITSDIESLTVSKGFYAIKLNQNYLYKNFYFILNEIKVKKEYQPFFKKMYTPIHIISIEDQEQLANLASPVIKIISPGLN